MQNSITSLKPFSQRILIVSLIILITLGYAYQKRKIYLSLTSIHGPVLKHLPKFKIENFFTGKNEDSSNFLKNSKGTLFHFWGTWCGPCAVEFPSIMKFSVELKKHGINLVLVDVNDTKIKAKKFLRKFSKYRSDNLFFTFDEKGKTMPLFGTSKVPETFLFDSKGNHLKKYVGPQEWENKRYLTQILDFLK